MVTGRIPLRDGLLTTIDDPAAARLLGGRCPRCERLHFPAQATCPYCSAGGCAAVPMSPRGVLDVCTTVINRPPGYDGPLPFGFGVVELPEGLRIISRIDDPLHVRPGDAVRLTLETLSTDTEGREVITYAFARADR